MFVRPNCNQTYCFTKKEAVKEALAGARRHGIQTGNWPTSAHRSCSLQRLNAWTIGVSVWPSCSRLGRACKFSLVCFALAYPVTFLIVAKHQWRALILEIYLRLLHGGGVNICSKCKDRAGPNCFFNDILIISSCIFIMLAVFCGRWSWGDLFWMFLY